MPWICQTDRVADNQTSHPSEKGHFDHKCSICGLAHLTSQFWQMINNLSCNTCASKTTTKSTRKNLYRTKFKKKTLSRHLLYLQEVLEVLVHPFKNITKLLKM